MDETTFAQLVVRYFKEHILTNKQNCAVKSIRLAKDPNNNSVFQCSLANKKQNSVVISVKDIMVTMNKLSIKEIAENINDLLKDINEKADAGELKEGILADMDLKDNVVIIPSLIDEDMDPEKSDKCILRMDYLYIDMNMCYRTPSGQLVAVRKNNDISPENMLQLWAYAKLNSTQTIQLRTEKWKQAHMMSIYDQSQSIPMFYMIMNNIYEQICERNNDNALIVYPDNEYEAEVFLVPQNEYETQSPEWNRFLRMIKMNLPEDNPLPIFYYDYPTKNFHEMEEPDAEEENDDDPFGMDGADNNDEDDGENPYGLDE